MDSFLSNLGGFVISGAVILICAAIIIWPLQYLFLTFCRAYIAPLRKFFVAPLPDVGEIAFTREGADSDGQAANVAGVIANGHHGSKKLYWNKDAGEMVESSEDLRTWRARWLERYGMGWLGAPLRRITPQPHTWIEILKVKDAEKQTPPPGEEWTIVHTTSSDYVVRQRKKLVVTHRLIAIQGLYVGKIDTLGGYTVELVANVTYILKWPLNALKMGKFAIRAMSVLEALIRKTISSMLLVDAVKGIDAEEILRNVPLETMERIGVYFMAMDILDISPDGELSRNALILLARETEATSKAKEAVITAQAEADGILAKLTAEAAGMKLIAAELTNCPRLADIQIADRLSKAAAPLALGQGTFGGIQYGVATPPIPTSPPPAPASPPDPAVTGTPAPAPTPALPAAPAPTP